MKRIVTIQDISCLGKCSLTVALPIISSMGIETCVVPTAVLSTHTAFKGFTFRDLTSDINKISDHWMQEKVHFDAIYTGYLGSFEQLELMQQFISDFGERDTFTIIDPCMADNGNLYHGFTQEFAFAMAKLCAKGNVIVPNMTEACFMLGRPYAAAGTYDEAFVLQILRDLADLGAEKIVLKGIEFSEDQENLKNIKGKMGIATYDSTTDTFSWYFHKKLEQSFHGTGDIFASVLTGALMRGISLQKSCSLAADFVVESIKATLAETDYNWYGVNFEQAIPYLLRRIQTP